MLTLFSLIFIVPFVFDFTVVHVSHIDRKRFFFFSLDLELLTLAVVKLRSYSVTELFVSQDQGRRRLYVRAHVRLELSVRSCTRAS